MAYATAHTFCPPSTAALGFSVYVQKLLNLIRRLVESNLETRERSQHALAYLTLANTLTSPPKRLEAMQEELEAVASKSCAIGARACLTGGKIDRVRSDRKTDRHESSKRRTGRADCERSRPDAHYIAAKLNVATARHLYQQSRAGATCLPLTFSRRRLVCEAASAQSRWPFAMVTSHSKVPRNNVCQHFLSTATCTCRSCNLSVPEVETDLLLLVDAGATIDCCRVLSSKQWSIAGDSINLGTLRRKVPGIDQGASSWCRRRSRSEPAHLSINGQGLMHVMVRPLVRRRVPKDVTVVLSIRSEDGPW